MKSGYPPDEHFLRRYALDALQGVGDANLGQWIEWAGTYYHVRRRLSYKEQQIVGEAKDIRGTQEAFERHETVKCYLPAWMRDIKDGS